MNNRLAKLNISVDNVEYASDVFKIVNTVCGKRMLVHTDLIMLLPKRLSVKYNNKTGKVSMHYGGVYHKYQSNFSNIDCIAKKLPAFLLWIIKEDLLVDTPKPIRLVFGSRTWDGSELPVLTKITMESSRCNVLRQYDFESSKYIKIAKIYNKTELRNNIKQIKKELTKQYKLVTDNTWDVDRVIQGYLPRTGLCPHKVFDFNFYTRNNSIRLQSDLTMDFIGRNYLKLLRGFSN